MIEREGLMCTVYYTSSMAAAVDETLALLEQKKLMLIDYSILAIGTDQIIYSIFMVSGSMYD